MHHSNNIWVLIGRYVERTDISRPGCLFCWLLCILRWPVLTRSRRRHNSSALSLNNTLSLGGGYFYIVLGERLWLSRKTAAGAADKSGQTQKTQNWKPPAAWNKVLRARVTPAPAIGRVRRDGGEVTHGLMEINGAVPRVPQAAPWEENPFLNSPELSF